MKQELRDLNVTPPRDADTFREVKKALYYVGRLGGLLRDAGSPERREEVSSIIWGRFERKIIGPARACQFAENAEKVRRAMGIED